ncbi:MAG: DUF937 domain-containing protein, partial [Sphingomicrobium sp.]
SAIAQHLGVDEATVERGAGALLPHVQNGIETQGLPGIDAAEVAPAAAPEESGGILGGLLGGAGGGLGGMLGGLMGGAGAGGILGSLGGGMGNQVLGQIFGSKDASRDVATQASQTSGVDSSVLRKLLPIVAGAVAMHYITHRGGAAAQTSDGSADQGGGGILGSILSGLTGR